MKASSRDRTEIRVEIHVDLSPTASVPYLDCISAGFNVNDHKPIPLPYVMSGLLTVEETYAQRFKEVLPQVPQSPRPS